jgi:cytochrome c oxidase subunit 2
VVLLATACGGDAADGPALSSEASAGRRIATSAGCASCHGSDGEGNVGPAFVGLLGSERELRDGTTVIADEAYLRESIQDPSAKMVAGYSLRMPTNNLSDAEIDQIITWITELSTAAPEPTP